MGLAIKCTLGTLKDQVFPIKEGLSIGRQGDIQLEDIKVSSIHARVVQRDGKWFVEDYNSKNGIKVGGIRMESVELTPAIAFEIGDSVFEVIQMIEAPELMGSDGPKKKKKSKGKRWHDVLTEFLGNHRSSFKNDPVEVDPLEPAVVLDFIRGVQANSKWTLGYGPRQIGASSIDLPIWEPDAPAVCFELHPSKDGVVFKTAHSDVVTLNGERIRSRPLRIGDRIQILETVIEVDFAE